MAEYVVAAIVEAAERDYQERVRLERIRDASNPFQQSDRKFRKLFRLPRESILYLCARLTDDPLEEGSIPKHIKILAAMQFYSQGSYQAAVGQDNLLGLSQPSVSRCIEIVSEAILKELTPQRIKFPLTNQEKETAKRDFQELYNMPHTLGAIDGTHIAIAKPPIDHPIAPGNLFFNRKGFYSINCQIVTDARSRIIAVNPNFPGSTHDAAIWRASDLYHHLSDEFIRGERNQWLIGDKGYPLQPWLMTPVMAPRNEAEERYNEHHSAARNVVEMCFGRIKNKFRCIHRHRTLHYKPVKAAKIIVAVCTLYNMFTDVLSDDDDSDDSDGDDRDEDHDIDNAANQPPQEDNCNDFLTEARLVQTSIINNYFS